MDAVKIILIQVAIVAIWLWLCMVSYQVAVVTGIIVLFCGLLICGDIFKNIGSRKEDRDIIAHLAALLCPRCHEPLGLTEANRVFYEAERQSDFHSYQRNQLDYEEWTVLCPHCRGVGYFNVETRKLSTDSLAHED